MLSLARPIHVQPLLEFKTIAHTDVFAHACAPAPKLGEFTFELYVKLEKIASWCLPRWPRHVCFPLLYLSLCIVERFVGCTFAHAHTHTHIGMLALKVCLPNRYTYARWRSKFVFRTDTHTEQIHLRTLSIKVCLQNRYAY